MTTTVPAPRATLPNHDRRVLVRQVLVDTLVGITGADVFIRVLPALQAALEPHLKGAPDPHIPTFPERTAWTSPPPRSGPAEPAPPRRPAPPKLSSRMLDVLHGLADGLMISEIAAKLGVSNDTVKTHQKRLYRLLKAHNASHAVARGYQLGILN